MRALQRIHIDDESTGATSAANSSGDSSKLSGKHKRNYKYNVLSTVVPGFRVLGFSALPRFRALKAGDGAWSVHKTLFGFKVPLSKLLIENFLTIFSFLLEF